MRRVDKLISLSALFVLVSVSLIGLGMATGGSSVGGREAKSAANGPQPVDDDMHHFMEYVFEPNYKRLKDGMANAPEDKKAWKAIKGDVLTLAECANLLLMRVPDDDADTWRKLSVAVRMHGGELYQAARQSDYATARKAYVSMLNNCNSCHKQFADGKHQLAP